LEGITFFHHQNSLKEYDVFYSNSENDLLARNMAPIEHENDNRLLPKIFLDNNVFQSICTLLERCMVKFLGKKSL
jgi:hypothetical protein